MYFLSGTAPEGVTSADMARFPQLKKKGLISCLTGNSFLLFILPWKIRLDWVFHISGVRCSFSCELEHDY